MKMWEHLDLRNKEGQIPAPLYVTEKPAKISTKEQTIGVQVILKQNFFFSFYSMLAELTFREKNTISFYTSFFCSDIIEIISFPSWKI